MGLSAMGIKAARKIVFALLLSASSMAMATLQQHNFLLSGNNGERGMGHFTWDDAVMPDGGNLSGVPMPAALLTLSITISGGNVVGGTTTFERSDCTYSILDSTPDFSIDMGFECNNGVNEISLFFVNSASLNKGLSVIDFEPGTTSPVAITPKAFASYQPLHKFSIRLGFVVLEPSENDDFDLGTSYGLEMDFEWYFSERFGLELSLVIATDGSSYSNNDNYQYDGISTTAFTLGLNGHIVRNEIYDWYVGILVGVVDYYDFDYVSIDNNDFSSSNDLGTESTWGVQTGLDIKMGDFWSVDVGLKYLDSSIDVDNIDSQSIDIDPVIFNISAVFRF